MHTYNNVQKRRDLNLKTNKEEKQNISTYLDIILAILGQILTNFLTKGTFYQNCFNQTSNVALENPDTYRL